MSKKSLKQTNPFLKDPEICRQIIETVTVSSSSVEGVHAAAEKAMKNVTKNKMTTRAARACALSGKVRI